MEWVLGCERDRIRVAAHGAFGFDDPHVRVASHARTMKKVRSARFEVRSALFGRGQHLLVWRTADVPSQPRNPRSIFLCVLVLAPLLFGRRGGMLKA